MNTSCVFASFLVLLIFFSVSSLSVFAAQNTCFIDNNYYLCPTIASSLSRWGVEFRLYNAAPFVAYMNYTEYGSEPPMTSLSKHLPAIEDYLAGVNVNITKIDESRPVLIAANLDYQGASYPMMFLPDYYVSHSPPKPYNKNLYLSSFPQNTAIIVLSFTDPLTDDLIYSKAKELQTVLQQHQQGYNPAFFVATYRTNDTKTWPNEIWFVPQTEQQKQQQQKQQQQEAADSQ